MKRFAVSLTLLFGAAGCARHSHQSLQKQLVADMNAVIELLGSITDQASAEEAKPKLMKLTGHIKEVSKRMDALGRPSPQALKDLKENYRPQWLEVLKRMRAEVERVKKIPGGTELLTAIDVPMTQTQWGG